MRSKWPPRVPSRPLCARNDCPKVACKPLCARNGSRPQCARTGCPPGVPSRPLYTGHPSRPLCAPTGCPQVDWKPLCARNAIARSKRLPTSIRGGSLRSLCARTGCPPGVPSRPLYTLVLSSETEALELESAPQGVQKSCSKHRCSATLSHVSFQSAALYTAHGHARALSAPAG